MKEQTFAELQLAAPIVRALSAKNYENPTPIQSEAIPPLLKGRDLIGCAQTGTGKTAAFALPILQKIYMEPKLVPSRGARVLVLTPTRELAAQVGKSFQAYGRYLKLSHALVYGGVGQNPQVKALRRGVDVLVATPGRLLDLMEQGHIKLKDVEAFVLDEADRMLDMGFLPDIKKVMARLPRERQTLLFSATMSPEILKLITEFLSDPVTVAVSPPSTVAARIDERILFVNKDKKRFLLEEILRDPDTDRALVFTRTKHGANRLVTQLEKASIKARAIHGNKSQSARTAALEDFRRGRCQVLVATDVAARGIDVAGISHVINYDFPNDPESYVHRIGRTGRAGGSGMALSFCDSEERLYLRDTERLLKRQLPVESDHPYHSTRAAQPAKPSRKRNGKGRPGKRHARRRSGARAR